MSVQAGTESLLVQVMGNQTNASAQNEQTIQDTHLEVILGLLSAKCSTVAHQVNEADSHGTIDVQDQIVLLGRSDRLDSKSIIQHLAAGEALLDELLDELNSQIGVVSRLDFVANSGDELVLFAHGVNKVTWAETLIERLCELLGCTVKSTTKS
jgi:hypothetical protein